MAKKVMRDVVVVLPGITGSVLQKDGKDVWNVTSGWARRLWYQAGFCGLPAFDAAMTARSPSWK